MHSTSPEKKPRRTNDPESNREQKANDDENKLRQKREKTYKNRHKMHYQSMQSLYREEKIYFVS